MRILFLAAAAVFATLLPSSAQQLSLVNQTDVVNLLPEGIEPLLTTNSQALYEAKVATALRLQSPLTAGISQTGFSNSAVSGVFDSPGTTTVQQQVGSNNVSRVGVLGGAANGVNVGQFGNNLDSTVFMLNSQGTEVIHSQNENGARGGVLVINGYPGLRVQVR